MIQTNPAIRLALLVVAPLTAAVFAQSARGQSEDPSLPGDALVAIRAVLDHEALAPGSDATVGVLLSIAPEWHVYWRNSGDTGMPVSIEFEASPGVTVGPLIWPAPTRYQSSPEAADYIYEKQVLLMAPVHVEKSVQGGTFVTIRAKVDFLVCQASCLPGSGSASVLAPVALEAKVSARNEDLFAKWRARVPLPEDKSEFTTRWDGLTLVVDAPGAERIEFFPYEPEEPAPVSALNDGSVAGDVLRMRYPERIVHAERVAGVVSITKGGKATAYESAIPAPALR